MMEYSLQGHACEVHDLSQNVCERASGIFIVGLSKSGVLLVCSHFVVFVLVTQNV